MPALPVPCQPERSAKVRSLRMLASARLISLRKPPVILQRSSLPPAVSVSSFDGLKLPSTKATKRIAAPARIAVPARARASEEEILARLADSPPPIAADAELDIITKRRPHFKARAKAGRRNRELVKNQPHRISVCRNATKTRRKFTQLQIAKRRILPAITAIDDAERGIGPAIFIVAKIKSAIHVHRKNPRRLACNSVSSDSGATARRARPAWLIFRAAIYAATLACDNWRKTIAARIIRRNRDVARTNAKEAACLCINAVSAAIGRTKFGFIRPLPAIEFDDPAKRTQPCRWLTAAPPYADTGKIERIIARPTYPAAERISLRHAIDELAARVKRHCRPTRAM